jgi:hypothetical protein
MRRSACSPSADLGVHDAAKPAWWQTLGFLERLLEVAGATDVSASFTSRAWEGDMVTTIALRWKQAPVSSNPGSPRT